MDPWTFEYNGFTFSSENGACISEIDGFGIDNMRTSDHVLPGQHGAVAGLDRLEPRTFDIELDVISQPEDLFGILMDLSEATAPRDDELPLKFKLAEGMPTMRINCRARRRNIPLTNRHKFGSVKAQLQFWASDPFFYGDTQLEDSTPAATEAGGRSFDWGFDWDYEAAAGESGEMNVINNGTAPTHWIARVDGPCTNPTVGGENGFVQWEGTIASGEFVEFNANPKFRTVMLGGTSTRFDNLTLDSTWFSVLPGGNSVRFSTQNGNGTLTFKWRSAWWSAT